VGIKLEDLDQLVKFFFKIDEDSARQLAQSAGEINDKRIQDLFSSEDIASERIKQSFDLRRDLTEREQLLKEAILQKTEQEHLDHIERIIEAERQKLGRMEQMEKEALAKGQQLNEDALKEKQELQERLGQREEAVADIRQRAGMAEPGAPTGPQGMAGAVSSAFEKHVKGPLLNIAGMFGFPSISSFTVAGIAIAAIKLLRDAFALSREMQRQSAQLSELTAGGVAGAMAGASPGLGAQATIRELEDVMGDLKVAFPSLEKEMIEAAKEFATELPKSVRTAEEFRQALLEARAGAHTLSISQKEFAHAQSILMKDLQLTSNEAFAQLIFVRQAGEKLLRETEKQEFSLANFNRNVLKAFDALRPFNMGLSDATGLISKFAVQLERGTVSVSDLISFVQGLGKQDAGSQAFVAQQIQQRLSGQAGFAEIASLLREQGQDPLAASRIIEGLIQGNPLLREQLGLSEDQARRLQRQVLQAPVAIAKGIAEETAGPGGGFAAEARAAFVADQILKRLGIEGGQQEVRDMLRREESLVQPDLEVGPKGQLMLSKKQLEQTNLQLRATQEIQKSTESFAGQFINFYKDWARRFVEGVIPDREGKIIGREQRALLSPAEQARLLTEEFGAATPVGRRRLLGGRGGTVGEQTSQGGLRVLERILGDLEVGGRGARQMRPGAVVTPEEVGGAAQLAALRELRKLVVEVEAKEMTAAEKAKIQNTIQDILEARISTQTQNNVSSVLRQNEERVSQASGGAQ